MFRTSQGPSSGSRELYLAEVTDIGSVLSVVSFIVSVWLRILTVKIIMVMVKGKAVPLQAWSGPEVRLG
jgi:hypothetical protein